MNEQEQSYPQPAAVGGGGGDENDTDFRIDLARLCRDHTIDLFAGVVMQTTSAGLRIGGVVIDSLELTDPQKDRLTDKLMYVFRKWLREEGLVT